MESFYETQVAVELRGNSSSTHRLSSVELYHLYDFLDDGRQSWLSDDNLGELMDGLDVAESAGLLTVEYFFDKLGDYDLDWRGGTATVVQWSTDYGYDEDDDLVIVLDDDLVIVLDGGARTVRRARLRAEESEGER